MAKTDAEICNLALAKVGEKGFIDSLTEDSEQARLCNELYETSRDSVLEERPWPFATRRAPLALLTITRTGWAYVYGVPADCLPGGERYIETGIKNPSEDHRPAFELEDDAVEGAVLLTDQSGAVLVYTRRVTEVVKMTPLFQEALSWKLAYELALCLPVKEQLAARLEQGYELKLGKAAASAFKHRQASPPPRPAAIRARQGQPRER